MLPAAAMPPPVPSTPNFFLLPPHDD
uniref:Uncharacterized protein n=1 Tax=Arundo donax TaxID=35708 RepID=A0A0A9AN96_ARUDO